MKNNKNTAEIKKATKNLALWTMLWMASLALATFGPKLIWNGNFTFSLIAMLVNAMLGAGLILAHIKHISALDELQKKVQMDAMGIALGVGIIGGMSYSVMDISNIISGDAQISYLVMLISISYMIALTIGTKRYS